MFATVVYDLRMAWRGLRARPAFTLTAVATLALGIGATTAVFSVVNGVLLRPLPLEDPEALVWLWSADAEQNQRFERSSEANVVDWRARATSFSALAAAHNRALTWRSGDQAVKLSAVVTTVDFFDVLGARPLLGRTFVAGDQETPVVVLSHAGWRLHFGADPQAVGRRMELDGVAHTVIGVMAADFVLPRDEIMVYQNRRLLPEARRPVRIFWVLGRLAEGVTATAAGGEMARIAADLAAEHPQVNGGWGVNVVPLKAHLVRDARAPLLLVTGAVVLVLLIACVNVANLLLARGADRVHEIAVRRALGASRRRIAGRLLLESLLLAALGGVAGCLVAAAALPLLLALEPGSLPRLPELAVDGAAFAFACAAALLTGAVFALVPALTAAGGDLVRGLRAGERRSTGGRSRLRAGLVVAEVALAVVLLVTAGLLLRSFVARYQADPGFRPQGLAMVRIFTEPGSLRGAAKHDYLRGIEAALAAVPGVRAVGGGTTVPFSGVGPELAGPYLVADGAGRERVAEAPQTEVRGVTPGFLPTLGVPLVRGRMLEDFDRADGAAVVLVNQTLARRAWPGRDPLGRMIRLEHGDWRPRRVVGVVGDLRQDGPGSAPRPEVYLPYTQLVRYLGLAYAVRTDGDPAAMVPALQRAVLDFDPLQPPHETTTFDALRGETLAGQRLVSAVVALFGALALLLAAIGLYAVVAYAVSRRRHEIGVRMALGARRRQVFALVVRQALGHTALGLAIGLLAAQAASRVLGGALFGVSAHDPLTLAAVAAGLLAVALLASYLPARRATAVDPLVALRQE